MNFLLSLSCKWWNDTLSFISNKTSRELNGQLNHYKYLEPVNLVRTKIDLIFSISLVHFIRHLHGKLKPPRVR